MRHQLKSEWCWAAVSQSVDQFFPGGSNLTQCQIVTATRRDLHGLDCCASADPKCNQPYYLQAGLKKVRRLAEDPISSGLSLTDLKKHLSAGNPVCAMIQWRSKGAHFILISGCRTTPSGTAVVSLEDPLYGASEMPFDLFHSTAPGEGYRGSGVWAATFLVSPDGHQSG